MNEKVTGRDRGEGEGFDQCLHTARNTLTELVGSGLDIFDCAVTVGIMYGFIQVWANTARVDPVHLAELHRGFRFGEGAGMGLAEEAAEKMNKATQ